MNRTEKLIEHFERSFGAGILPVPVPLEHWPVSETDMLHTPFGFATPDDGSMFFCPELIVKQTSELNDDEYGMYVDALALHATMHVIHQAQPIDEIERIIDKALGDIAPSGLTIVNQVQMRVLDG